MAAATAVSQDAEHYRLMGNAAVQAGDMSGAIELYSKALELDDSNLSTLCNRSALLLKQGCPLDAAADATRAWSLIQSSTNTPPEFEVKVCHRLAQAQQASQRPVDAVRTYCQGLRRHPNPQLQAALHLLLEQLPVTWLAQYWSLQIESAQAPHPLSSRDGVLLRPVPTQRQVSPAELRAHLEVGLADARQAQEARDLMCDCWGQGKKKPGRAAVAYMRALAYFNAGHPEQTLKDVSFALVYGPKAPKANAQHEDIATWPAALVLQSSALEAKHDNVPAAMAIARALELEPGYSAYEESLERLLRRIPHALADILSNQGVDALEAALAADKERAKPEFLKQRPKYYYYYEWMKKRIEALHPGLPEPVMDKMLTLEAGELDLLLQYPVATSRTVGQLEGVLEEQGQEALSTYKVPLLTWDEVQELKQSDQVPALPPGDTSASPLMLGQVDNNDDDGDDEAQGGQEVEVASGAEEDSDGDSYLCTMERKCMMN